MEYLPMSATTGHCPYAVLLGNDGNLWVNYSNGSAWLWQNLGRPSTTVTISDPVAITVVGSNNISIFVRGNDGHLWVNWWNGSRWTWFDQGMPSPSTTVSRAVGATYFLEGSTHVFVLGSDGHLWINWWNGSHWSWLDQGTPPSHSIHAPIGAFTAGTSSARQPAAVVLGDDGHLWLNWWNSSTGTWLWEDQLTPPDTQIVSALGTCVINQVGAYIFVRSTDGCNCVNWWSNDDGTWHWGNLSRPKNGPVLGAVSVLPVCDRSPYVCVLDDKNNLWINWWNTSSTEWTWSCQGTPTASTMIVYPVGATLVGSSQPYLFFVATDGNLWLQWWSDETQRWTWSCQGKPDGVAIQGAMGAFSVDLPNVGPVSTQTHPAGTVIDGLLHALEGGLAIFKKDGFSMFWNPPKF